MPSLLKFVLLSVLFCDSLSAQWQTIGNVDSFSVAAAGELRVFSGKNILQAKALAPDLIRIRLAINGLFEPDQSWAIARKEWPRTTLRVSESADRISAATSEIILQVKKKPLRLAFHDKNGNLINEDDPSKGMAWSNTKRKGGTTEVRVWKIMPQGEHYYGFGEKAGSLDRRGTAMTMWNSDIPGYKGDTDPLYQSIPFFLGINKGRTYGVFFDNSWWSSFEMGKESRSRYSFGAEAGELNYYFMWGPSPKKVLSRFTELVGRMPLPPLWSLGYQQCRWSYSPESRVREIADGFRKRRIPCDVIYLDIDYMDGYRIFTWNPKNFPAPGKLISDLANDGFKVAVIVDPGIKLDSSYHAYRSGIAGNHFLKYPDGRPFIGKVWPGDCMFPDFTSSEARAWWGRQFSLLADHGVRGWWNDMNEPSVSDGPQHTVDLSVIHDDNGLRTPHAKNHNVYGMLMTRATYEGVRALLPEERPFILTRASYAGGQRYAAAWTGDNVASWEHLEMAIPMCLNLSMSGQPFVGTDIGGFIGYPGGELFARWLQLGVFTPLMRAHSVINEKNKEPWEYGDEITKINKETIELRYRLLPYIYTVISEASISGIPPMRALAFEYPEDESFTNSAQEFMFGDDLLVAPVLTEGASTRSLHLPSGEWYDFWTGRKYQGGENVTVDAPLDRIPIFVKAGAVLPSRQIVQYVEESPVDPLTLSVYPSSSTSTSLFYEDDGRTFRYENGEFFRRTVQQSSTAGSISVSVSRTEGTYVPARRILLLRFIDISRPPVAVALGDVPLKHVTGQEFESGREGWRYDAVSGQVWVRTTDQVAEQRFVLKK